MAPLNQNVVRAALWRSVSFMHYRDRKKSVNFLRKDYEDVNSYATEVLIEGDTF